MLIRRLLRKKTIWLPFGCVFVLRHDIFVNDMAGLQEEAINFNELETELEAAIEEDAKYWRENDAKIRAVTQGVASYDEFCEIVKASHLKPLDKSERLNNLQSKRGSIWNSITTKRKDFDMEPVYNQQNMLTEDDRLPTSCADFVKRWRKLDICDKLSLLKSVGAESLGHMFRSEIPVGMLGELVETLLAFPSNTEDIIFVVRLLEVLTEAKRFNLSLQFLTSIEKLTCKELMEKINSSFQNRQQDLADEGITEWTISELRNKYKV